MLVYPADLERRVRARLGRLRDETEISGRRWAQVDLTDAFGLWLAGHEYAEALIDDPTNLTSGLLEGFEDAVCTAVTEALERADDATIVAVVGTAAVFPYLSVSRLVERVER